MASLLVLSSYPPQEEVHSAVTVGGASYTKTLLAALKNTSPTTEIKVLAEVLDQLQTNQNEDITVQRFWRRNNPLSILQTCRELLAAKEQNLLLSMEVYMFGGVSLLLPILLTLFIAQYLQGKKVITLVHQVVFDFSKIEKKLFKQWLLALLSRFLYWLVTVSSTQLVVFEKQLQTMLGNTKKSVYIPHYIPVVKPLDKKMARQQLQLDGDKKYLLYFGYLSPYKGIDWLVENFVSNNDMQLIVAGDINPNHRHNPKMVSYVDQVKQTAQKNGHLVTGFIDESDILVYFSAVDTVIFPYVSFISSSGPLSFALAYQKSVLLSEALAGYLDSPDIKNAFEATGLKESEVIFPFSSTELKNRIENLPEKKHLKFAKMIAEQRSLKNVAVSLHSLLQ